MAIRGGPDIIEDGLVLHLDAADRNSYPLTGNIWYDLSGNVNNFTLYNGASYSNSSIVFDGTDDNVGRSTPSVLQLKNDKTLEFWFNHSSSGGDSTGALIRTGLGYDLLYCLFSSTSGQLSFHWYNNSFQTVYSNASVYSLNTFVCGCASISGTTLTFYVNGQSAGVSTVSIPSANSASLIGIGATRSGTAVGTTGQDLSGKISVVKIYNRALSANEILQNYNATKGRFGL